MINELSILLPSYNNCCAELVAALQRQAEAAARKTGLDYEIIVGDDGSTDTSAVERNKAIDSLPRCRYIIRKKNTGRAAIRNFLAREARCEWLLFIDSDMTLHNGKLIDNYINTETEGAIYGGYEIRGDETLLRGNLRYKYEKSASRNNSATERRRSQYDKFHISNFAIRRAVMLAHPLDERITRYGHEDLLFGKTLELSGIRITHIDNPVTFEDFETNADFMAKTEESVAMLCELENELRDFSNIIKLTERLERLRLTPAVRLFYKIFSNRLKSNLTGNKPSVLLFNIYKLGMFCTIKYRKTRPKTSHPDA